MQTAQDTVLQPLTHLVTGAVRYPVHNLAAASLVWRNYIEERNLGVREIPAEAYPKVEHGGKVYRMSYNGKIWDGETCIYSPYAN